MELASIAASWCECVCVCKIECLVEADSRWRLEVGWAGSRAGAGRYSVGRERAPGRPPLLARGRRVATLRPGDGGTRLPKQHRGRYAGIRRHRHIPDTPGLIHRPPPTPPTPPCQQRPAVEEESKEAQSVQIPSRVTGEPASCPLDVALAIYNPFMAEQRGEGRKRAVEPT